jgi:lipid A 4'-phosphatase
MGRAWVLGAVAVGAVTGILFAIFPEWDLQIAGWFWDPVRGKFPLSIQWLPNVVRTIGDWTVWSIVLAAAGALVIKLIFPGARMLIRPSTALFLVCSFAIGPGLVVNGLTNPLWARPRPVFVEQFGGHQHFEPWWKPGGDCRRNCSFLSGEASEAFWLLAPASIAPALIRPVALAAAAVSAVGLSGLRIAFGRHFVTDVIFGGVLTVIIVAACDRFFLRGQDDKFEQRIGRLAVRLRSRRAGRRRPGVPSPPPPDQSGQGRDAA